MTDQERIKVLTDQVEALKKRMADAGYFPDEPTAPDNSELDLEAELEKTKAVIREFSKRIK